MKKIILVGIILCSFASMYTMEWQIDEEMEIEIEQKVADLSINNKKLVIKNRRNRPVWVEIKKQDDGTIVKPKNKQIIEGRFALEDKEDIEINYDNIGDDVVVRVWDNQTDASYYYIREMKTTNQFSNEPLCIESDYIDLDNM